MELSMRTDAVNFRLLIEVYLLCFKLSLVKFIKLIFFLLVNLPPFPVDLVLTKLVLKKITKCCWDKMIKWSCLTKPYLAIITTAHIISQQQKTIAFLIWHHSLEEKTATWWHIKIDHIGIHPTLQAWQFVFRKLDTYT